MVRLLWVLIPALVLLSLLLWLLPPREAKEILPPATSPSRGLSQASPPVPPPTEAQQGERVPWAERPLEELDPGAVERVEKREDRYVLRFVDGSERTVYPFQLSYLPEGLRFLLEYERGRP